MGTAPSHRIPGAFVWGEDRGRKDLQGVLLILLHATKHLLRHLIEPLTGFIPHPVIWSGMGLLHTREFKELLQELQQEIHSLVTMVLLQDIKAGDKTFKQGLGSGLCCLVSG